MVWEAKIANFSSKERNISMAFTEHYFVEVSIFTIKKYSCRSSDRSIGHLMTGIK
jgi:hypothetical protein